MGGTPRYRCCCRVLSFISTRCCYSARSCFDSSLCWIRGRTLRPTLMSGLRQYLSSVYADLSFSDGFVASRRRASAWRFSSSIASNSRSVSSANFWGSSSWATLAASRRQELTGFGAIRRSMIQNEEVWPFPCELARTEKASTSSLLAILRCSISSLVRSANKRQPRTQGSNR